MSKTENHLLSNPKVKPTDKIIAEGLGKANKAFVRFIAALEYHDITLMDWRYYNDGKVWLSKGEYKWLTKRGTEKIKPIFWLSIWEGFFKVSFFFSFKIKSELLSLPISKEAKEIIDNAKPMGKTMRFLPIVFDISDEKLLDDLYIVAQFRKENI